MKKIILILTILASLTGYSQTPDEVIAGNDVIYRENKISTMLANAKLIPTLNEYDVIALFNATTNYKNTYVISGNSDSLFAFLQNEYINNTYGFKAVLRDTVRIDSTGNVLDLYTFLNFKIKE